MTKGSTPTTPKRRLSALVTGDAPTRAACTADARGRHFDGSSVSCPACWPTAYAHRHGRHRSDSFRYSTTEAHGVTR